MILAIIQARMGSTRLPGKVLKPILGKPIINYQVERVKQSKALNQVIIATSKNVKDDAIIYWCEANSIPYYRGDEADVLGRYYEAAKQFSASTIVRLTGDCPIIDSDVIDRVIIDYLKEGTSYCSNTIKRSFPRGMDTEVFSMDALERANYEAKSPLEREHVTTYIRNHFSTFNVFNNTDYSNHRWTVDTKEDFQLIKKIITELYPNNPLFTMEDVVRLLANNPDWMLINKDVKQKDG
ncbi:glycosyltransferase family protein [Ornithinibacillus massiliensis]|uniref:Glycosyltransferase family protein n=1 Tax=Ornithinibacillus massiliensis TaxID=1944633 RepID=A0ABS5MGI9_9BACI|nr:glycosyltransferase family protein [Ornithinibacillus massiliensis]MBS3681217.1 glycosyltransferase family protein [Ornithinibacillus massiliensis]